MFLILDLEKIIFYVFCAMQNKAVMLYLISLSWRVTFMEISGTFLYSGYVSRDAQSFKGFG